VESGRYRTQARLGGVWVVHAQREELLEARVRSEHRWGLAHASEIITASARTRLRGFGSRLGSDARCLISNLCFCAHEWGGGLVGEDDRSKA